MGRVQWQQAPEDFQEGHRVLNRQKTLLLLLELARRPMCELELTGWAFLLGKQMPSRGGNAYYDFLPSSRGPLSFCLRREMDALIRDGFVKDEGAWAPAKRARDVIHTLPEAIRRDGQRVVHRFSTEPTSRLADYIHSVFPRFASDSEERTRPSARPANYTAGYERLSVDAFLDRLIRKGIEWIIDVRANPIARRIGFHKSTLTRLGGRVGIQYRHEPRLGIQSAFRRNLHTQADYDVLFNRYVNETLAVEGQAIHRVSKMMAEKACVLVCMEADPNFCHRTRLAEAVSEETRLPVRDLGSI